MSLYVALWQSYSIVSSFDSWNFNSIWTIYYSLSHAQAQSSLQMYFFACARYNFSIANNPCFRIIIVKFLKLRVIWLQVACTCRISSWKLHDFVVSFEICVTVTLSIIHIIASIKRGNKNWIYYHDLLRGKAAMKPNTRSRSGPGSRIQDM